MSPIVLGLVALAVVASVAGWLWRRLVQAEQRLELARARELEATRELARLQATLDVERRQATEREKDLVTRFEALSARIVQDNTAHFLELAAARFGDLKASAHSDVAALVQPVQQTLEQFNAVVRDLEKARSEAYGGLRAQIDVLSTAHTGLQQQTQALAQALTTPSVRGRWGELQLRRVVELAGMVEHCDFVEQDAGDGQRPDMVVRLPGEREVVVDAKSPIKGYLEALQTRGEEQRHHLDQFSGALKRHLQQLGAKAYWERLQTSPEFVVMFLPGEMLLGAALQHAPDLMEYGFEKRVLMATPTTLIALLRTVALGWREQSMARNAEAISELGRTLYDRLRTMSEHLTSVGKGLDVAVRAYNKSVGSYETRVLPSARGFETLGCSTGDALEPPARVEVSLRALAAPATDRDVA